MDWRSEIGKKNCKTHKIKALKLRSVMNRTKFEPWLEQREHDFIWFHFCQIPLEGCIRFGVPFFRVSNTTLSEGWPQSLCSEREWLFGQKLRWHQDVHRIWPSHLWTVLYWRFWRGSHRSCRDPVHLLRSKCRLAIDWSTAESLQWHRYLISSNVHVTPI